MAGEAHTVPWQAVHCGSVAGSGGTVSVIGGGRNAAAAAAAADAAVAVAADAAVVVRGLHSSACIPWVLCTAGYVVRCAAGLFGSGARLGRRLNLAGASLCASSFAAQSRRFGDVLNLGSTRDCVPHGRRLMMELFFVLPCGCSIAVHIQGGRGILRPCWAVIGYSVSVGALCRVFTVILCVLVRWLRVAGACRARLTLTAGCACNRGSSACSTRSAGLKLKSSELICARLGRRCVFFCQRWRGR